LFITQLRTSMNFEGLGIGVCQFILISCGVLSKFQLFFWVMVQILICPIIIPQHYYYRVVFQIHTWNLFSK
jgi:hypothetical protein